MLRLFLLQPAVLLAAQVNQSNFTYPISEVAFDNITAGSVAAVQPGVTVAFGTTPGADDRGRQRVVDIDSDTLFIPPSSRGRHDGEVDLADNLYITIWWDARVWARPPSFLPLRPEGTEGVTQYKDGWIAVGDYGSEPPPVANAGMAMAGTIDPVSGKLRVRMPAGHQDPAANLSFATADGATITGYQWSLPASGVTLVSGYALTDPVIEVDVNPGFYYVALQVTDSNGKSHRARVPIFARDPANDQSITAFEVVEHTITPAGQRLSVRILEDIPASQYPDGTLVMLWEDEPLTPSDRSHMRFVGWHHVDPASIQGSRGGTLRDVVLECLDVAGKLDALPGWPQTIRAESIRSHDGVANPTWEYMTNPTLNKYIHYLLHWHSTALEVADFTWAEDDLPFVVLESSGASLYDQVQRVAQSFCPDHHFTCDSRGRLRIVPDPMVQPEGERTATWRAAFGPADYTNLRYTHQRPPRVAYLRGAAIGAQTTPTIENGQLILPTYFCRAPGDARGQGEQHEIIHSQQLVADQATLNVVTGHRYARLNAPDSHFVFTLAQGSTFAVEPAEMVWVLLSISSSVAAQRGLTFTQARGLVHTVRIRYQHGRAGVIKTVEMEWEREVTGPPAVTELLPEADNKPADNWWPDDYWNGGTITYPEVGPELFDGGLYAGQQQVAVIANAVNVNGNFIYRTSDFQTAEGSGGPTWTEVSTPGVTDSIFYSWVVDPFSPGYRGTPGGAINGWVVGRSKIWRIEDIFGSCTVTPVYTFSQAVGSGTGSIQHWRTIQASFGRFFENESDNPWLMVVSHYRNIAGKNGTWAVYSQDAGQTWSSEVQITSHYDNGTTLSEHRPIGLWLSPRTPGLAITAAYTSTASPPAADAYISTDWGATWSALSDPDVQPGERLLGDIHVPWPDNDDESLVFHGYMDVGATLQYRLKRVTGTLIEDVSPSVGGRSYGCNRYGFGIRTYDLDRSYILVGGIGNDTTGAHSGDYHGVFLSQNGGNTWTTIVAPANNYFASFKGFSAAFAADNPAVFFIWGPPDTSTLGLIMYTEDAGANIEDKSGNLPSFAYDIDSIIGICGGPTA